MAGLIKGVRGGTAATEPSLCESCRYCQVMQGKAVSQRYQFCSAARQLIKFDVVECGFYEDKAKAELWTLEQVAWYLVPTEPHGALSFVPRGLFIKMKQANTAAGVPPQQPGVIDDVEEEG
jgi:hypothetical protein